MVATGLFVASLLALALGKPMGRNLQVHEARENIPVGFKLHGAAPADKTLKLRLALVQNNFAGLEERLYDVSTPFSSDHGNHLSKDEVEKYVTPSQESVDAVRAWLSENGLSAKTISPAGDWMAFEVPASQANEPFDADFSIFTHDNTDKDIVRTLSYSIPAELKGQLDFIHPTVTFPNPRSHLPVASHPVKTGTSNSITPACLQAIYGISSDRAKESSNKLAVSGFIEQFANKGDLQTWQLFPNADVLAEVPQGHASFVVETLDGGENPQNNPGIEANLDIQYTVGVSTGVPTVLITVGDQYQDGDLEGFLDIINDLLSQGAPPQVLTTSYGGNEGNISIGLANNLCKAYAQLDARGVSILFASGDGGVCGSQSSSCSDLGVNPETAADFSSGGFSNYWGVPDYQKDAISSYLSALGNTYSGKFNKSGRAYPDVSAQGVNFEIVVDGEIEAVDGTSALSPTFASIFALLNDRLIAAGKSPLGFLNPFLYSDGVSALNDVTSDSNPGCNTKGFPAKEGWDPVTGLGTPNFAKLLSAVGL
ncbi:family S53 protease [Trametes elegans]|nr:family S53 protease [Trametes elegans]